MSSTDFMSFHTFPPRTVLPQVTTQLMNDEQYGVQSDECSPNALPSLYMRRLQTWQGWRLCMSRSVHFAAVNVAPAQKQNQSLPSNAVSSPKELGH